MENLLKHYMEKRFSKESLQKQTAGPQPVITISRQAGCSGNKLASDLANRLNQGNRNDDSDSFWKVINKEIIEDAAHELELHPDKIKNILKTERKSALDEMIFSMTTRYYKSDVKIRKTITDVINSFVNRGNVIIVGRAGIAIAKEHPLSVHIKLQAPLDWRKEVISKKHKISIPEAVKYIESVDRSRNKLLSDFKCKTTNCIFDLVINCSRVSNDEATALIYQLMITKEYV